MKKDLWLLAGIGGVVAIALAIAAARGACPSLRPVNPLEKWSARQSFFASAIVLAATLLSIVAIGCNDHDLPQSSALLEWVWSPEKASEVVDAYGANRVDAIHGVLLDSVAFIPSYVLLIAITSFWIANGWTSERWAALLIATGWSAAFAGALDYLENAGIYAALGGVTTRLAPLTYAACQLKWVIACAAFDFAIIAALVRLVAFLRSS